MSTSPTFELTVLLWGDRWWVAARSEPLEFQNLTHAVEILAAHLIVEGQRVAVRLVYQPASLVSVAVACPDGNRATLQRALEIEHPALENPEIAWGYEPVLPIGEEHSTILHHEQEPGLFALVGALEQRGIDVVGAWPLATFLHALPGDWSESGAVAVLAVAPDRALAYHHPADGVREVKEWTGAGARTEALAWLGGLPSPSESKLVVAADDDTAAESADWTKVQLKRALAERVILPARHPAQLIPPAIAVPAERAMLAAGLLMTLAGAWFVASHARNYWTGLQRSDSQRAEIAALTQEVSHLRENEAAIARLQRTLAGGGPGVPISELLDALGRGLARTIAVDAIRANSAGFEVTGFVAAGAGEQFAAWQRNWADARWQVEPATGQPGQFTLKGKFLP